MTALSVVIADDHEVVRQGLRLLLTKEQDFRVVAEAADGVEALRAVEQHRPDLLVLDIGLPGVSGLEVTRETSRRSPRTRVLILSMHASETYVAEALRNGASGYVLKSSRSAEVLEAARHVSEGRRYLAAAVSQPAIDAYLDKIESGPVEPYETLTARERQVLQLTAEGGTAAEVAKQLFISARTVETHRQNLMRKLRLRTHTDLVLFALRRGLLPMN